MRLALSKTLVWTEAAAVEAVDLWDAGFIRVPGSCEHLVILS